MTSITQLPPTDDPTPRSGRLVAVFGAAGAAAFVATLIAIQPYQFNVANYSVVRSPQPVTPSSLGFVILILIGLGMVAVRSGASIIGCLSASAPLLFNAPLAILAALGRPIPYTLTLVLVLSAAWSAARLAAQRRPSLPVGVLTHWAAPIVLGIVLIAAVAVHAEIQRNFFEHFMLGHSDCGHFAEELKNALRGRGLRSDSFENTRLGWHFTPLLYALTPLYALWPSQRMLMVVGAVLLHLPALPIYWTARRWSGSAGIGLVLGLAWMLHPSVGRMAYSNTYGFQWVVACVPFLTFALWAGFARRFILTGGLLTLVWMCEETTTATTMGLGICLTLFTRFRKAGITVAVASVAYYLFCTRWAIPHFAASGRYERFSLFGELGDGPAALLSTVLSNPRVVAARLFRPSGVFVVLMWMSPMAMLAVWGWRLGLAAVPAAGLVLLMQNGEWLSVKFWHQASILPVLFFAAMLVLRPRAEGERRFRFVDRLLGSGSIPPEARNRAFAVGLLFAAGMGHYLYGFSPLSKSFEPYRNDAALSQPDPRFAFVRKLRSWIPREATVLATERLASHFTDVRELYTGRRVRPADYIILDRGDSWDTSGLPGRWNEFAASTEYELWKEFGSIVVYQRRRGTD